ncbi:TPA: adhesin, partial [Haemophilus influenzae]
APALGRTESTPNNNEYDSPNQINYKNKSSLSILTNTTLERILKRNTSVNITATKTITVNSDINIGDSSHLTLWSEGQEGGGVNVTGNITSTTNGNLTIYSGGWVDVHKNITLKSGYLNITTKQGDIAFEDKPGLSNLTITAKGTIAVNNKKGFRFDNVTLNGTGGGLSFKYIETGNRDSNFETHFRGRLNISGKVDILMQARQENWNRRHRGRSHWNVTRLNVSENSYFNVTIDSSGSASSPGAGPLNAQSGLNGISFNNDTVFNIAANSAVNFNIKPPIVDKVTNGNHTLFKGNISVLGGGMSTFILTPPPATTRLMA